MTAVKSASNLKREERKANAATNAFTVYKDSSFFVAESAVGLKMNKYRSVIFKTYKDIET